MYLAAKQSTFFSFKNGSKPKTTHKISPYQNAFW